MPEVKTNEIHTKTRRKIRLPRGLIIAWAVAGLLLLLYFIFLSSDNLTEAGIKYVSSPLRYILGAISSIFPFSVMELLYAAVIIGGVWYMALSVRKVVRSKSARWPMIFKRASIFLLVAVYIFTGYLWLWGIVYQGQSFAQRSGFNVLGVRTDDLVDVTFLFVEKANAFAPLVGRDDGGHFSVPVKDYFDAYKKVYSGIEEEFPVISGVSRRPKAMLFSKIMSYMGFTGIYFPFTGESNINVEAPGASIPFTIAHELAHQRGISSEAESNFIGVAACVSSGDTVYEYSGWYSGLIYLMNALYTVDKDTWREIRSGFCPELDTDWRDSSAYWASMESQITKVSETIYDGYLKAQGQDLGIKSYGACVDLLVEYFK